MSESQSEQKIPRFMRQMQGIRTGATASDSRYPIYKVNGDGKPHKIRILPGNYGGEDARIWYVEIFQHWGPNPKSNRGFNTSVYCRQHQSLGGSPLGGECCFCDEWNRLRDFIAETQAAIAETENPKDAAGLKAELAKARLKIRETSYRTSYALVVLDREDGNKMKIFYCPQTAFNQILTQYSSAQSESLEAMQTEPEAKAILDALGDDPENPELNARAFAWTDAFDASSGYDVEITRTTENKQTTYTVAMMRSKTQAMPTRDATQKLMDERFDLEKIVREAIDAEEEGDAKEILRLALEGAGSKKLEQGTMDPDRLNFSRRGGPAAAAPDHPDDEIPGLKAGAPADAGPGDSFEAVSAEDEAYLTISRPKHPPRPPQGEAAPPAADSARDRARRFAI